MARGGRKPGSANAITKSLIRALAVHPAPDLEKQLEAVASDDQTAVDVRLEAMRRLFGLFAGRVHVSALPAPPDVFAD